MWQPIFKNAGLLVLAVDSDGYFLSYILCFDTKIFDRDGKAGFCQGFSIFNRNTSFGANFLCYAMEGQVACYLYRVVAIPGEVHRFNIVDSALEVTSGVLVAMQIFGIEVILHFRHFESKAFDEQTKAEGTVI